MRVRRSRGPLFLVAMPLAWSLALFDLFVIGWMALSSLKTARELVQNPWSLPAQPQWGNYTEAWTAAKFGDGVVNSLLLVGGSGIGTILLAAPAAYVLARFAWRRAGPVMIFFAVGLGIPGPAIMIPLYLGLDRLGLIDSLGGLLIVYIATNLPFSVVFMTAFFASLPQELEEAAALDGSGPYRTFWRIMFPLTRSGLFALFVLQAIGDWGETFFALSFLQDTRTISLTLLTFMQTMQYTGARWSVLLAGICIVVLPLLLLYLWMSSRIIEGIAAGYGK